MAGASEGTAPDQVLVLVNGKRRHSAALLNLKGSVGRGSTGVDMNTIPPLAIERIEVLRDGAASQYGSDAIAGVINIQLKKREGGRAQVTYGKCIITMEDVAQVDTVLPTTGANDDPVITFTGRDRRRRDGDTITLAANFGIPVGGKAYVNITSEYKDRDPTNRSGPDIRRQYAGVGDPRETTVNRYSHRFGDGKSEDVNLFVNTGVEVGASLRANRFGSVFLPIGSNNDITIPKGAAPGDVTLSPKWVVDLEARFNPAEMVQVAVGANNLFDECPDRLPFGVVNGFNFGLNQSFLPYSSQSPFGFSGRFLYGRVSVEF
ncbi:TonB-dependent receptor plug domain-containing protein [Erythrobacter tepidarius]|uniref:TonB-dependent receptor plug domain-containing protein n=1 Tax=Erythrobacter tepidarius TaxID=60454 RepID=UPI000A3C885E